MISTNEKLIKKLSIKITETDESGSGFMLSQPCLKNVVYVLTAKHCLFGREYNKKPTKESVILNINSSVSSKYMLKKNDRILYFDDNDSDIAIIVIEKKSLENHIGVIPQVNAVVDRKSIRGCVIAGYPNEFELKECKTIECLFDLAHNENEFELSPQSRIETIEYDDKLDSIRGISGGAVVLDLENEMFLFGIVDKFSGWERFVGSNITVFNKLLLEKGECPIETIELELNAEIISSVETLENITQEEINRRHNKNKIGEIKLGRSDLILNGETLLTENKLLIVHGVAGVGKSIASYEILEKQKKFKNVIVFRADELIGGTLIDYLIAKGIKTSLTEILDSPILLSNKLIYIDAVENILEAQKFDAIESILDITKKRDDLKIILSIRSRYVDKLTALLQQVMPEKRAFLEIPLLSKDELSIVGDKYTWVTELLKNPKLSEILRTPFYLNHTISLSNSIMKESEISKRTLIIKLWQKIVINNNSHREFVFQEIVIGRAKAMKPFVKPSFLDNLEPLIKALSQLHQDEIVKSDEDEFGDAIYAPSHDVFQDWALIKFVNNLRESIPELFEFLKELGHQLAIRRGFRLWVSDQLDLGNFQAIHENFVLPIINNQVVFWKDEIVLSILRSENLDEFVTYCSQQLLDNASTLFFRFTRLLLISSKPLNNSDQIDSALFIDEELENAWKVITSFLIENNEIINPEAKWLIHYFECWKNRPKLLKDVIEENIVINNYCKSLMLSFDNERLNLNPEEKDVLLDLYIITSPKNNGELQNFVDSVVEFERQIDHYRRSRFNFVPIKEPETFHVLKSYFKNLKDKLLSGLEASKGLCFHFPELVFNYNVSLWKDENSFNDQYGSNSNEFEFGLSMKADNYFPASAFQTPIFNLLNFHPEETVISICEFLNYATDQYKNKKSQYRRDDIESIDFINHEGTEQTVLGSVVLWSIYRGTVQTSPYLLQSILMALEKYLLFLISRNDAESQIKLEKVFDLIYKTTTSVSPIAVIASVSMAHRQPSSISKFILPLFTSKNFFYWEISRWTGENSTLAPSGSNPIFQIERLESKELAHRKNYLENFLVRLSLTTILVHDIFSILDRYYSTRKTDNDNWSLMLNRMDIRKFEISDESQENQIIVKPKIDKSLEETVKNYEEESLVMNHVMAALNWSISIIANNNQSENIFEKWSFYFGQIIQIGQINTFDPSVSLAFIGLKYYRELLDEKNIQECKKIILNYAEKLIVLNEIGEPQISNIATHEKEPAFLSLPELLLIESSDNAKILELITHSIFGLDLSSGIDTPIFEKMTKRIWEINPDYANNLSRGLFNVKGIWANRPPYTYYPSKDVLKSISKYKTTMNKFFQNIYLGEQIKIDLDELKLDVSNSELIKRVFLFISGNPKLDIGNLNFLKDFSIILLETSLIKYSKFEKEDFKITSLKYLYFKKFAELVLDQPSELSKEIFDNIFNYIFNEHGKLKSNLTIEIFIFLGDCLDEIIRLQDQRETSESFWTVWGNLKSWQIENLPLFVDKLFLGGIVWKESAMSWKPLKGKYHFFIEPINNYGQFHCKSIVKLVSGIGFEEFGFILLAKISELVDTSDFNTVELRDIEKFIQRLFTLRRSEVIGNQKALNDMLNLLNKMIERESSVAFHIREVLISYLSR